MGKDSDEIRREIDQTRERMDDTVEAIGYRADVSSRLKDSLLEKMSGVKASVADAADAVSRARDRAGDVVSGAKDRLGNAVSGVSSRVSRTMSSVGGRVGEVMPDKEELQRSADRAVTFATENPLALAVGAVVAGFFMGMLMPVTRVERKRIGPLADRLKDQALESGRDAVERGKRAAQDAASAAMGTNRRERHDKPR